MRRALAVAAATAFAAPAPAHGATADLADGTGANGLTAVAGHLVFSERDAATGRWSLHQLFDGRRTRLPAGTRRTPFDADAGTDAAGRPVVTFSRCSDERRARGCVVRVMALTNPTAARTLRATHVRGFSETTPSMSDGAVAFARHRDGSFAVPRVELLERGATAARALAPVPVACEVDCDDRRVDVRVEGLDLGSRVVAYIADQAGADTIGIGDQQTLVVAPRDGGRATEGDVGYVDGACGYAYPFAPAASGLGARYVGAGAPCDKTETAFARFDATTRRHAVARPADGLIASAAFDGPVVYWLRLDAKRDDRFIPDARVCVTAAAGCRIVRSTGLRLRPGSTPHSEER